MAHPSFFLNLTLLAHACTTERIRYFPQNRRRLVKNERKNSWKTSIIWHWTLLIHQGGYQRAGRIYLEKHGNLGHLGHTVHEGVMVINVSSVSDKCIDSPSEDVHFERTCHFYTSLVLDYLNSISSICTCHQKVLLIFCAAFISHNWMMLCNDQFVTLPT